MLLTGAGNITMGNVGNATLSEMITDVTSKKLDMNAKNAQVELITEAHYDESDEMKSLLSSDQEEKAMYF